MEKQETRGLKLESIDQLGIVVRDIDKVIESWSKLLGIGPWDSREMETTDRAGRKAKTKLAFANIGALQIELIQSVEGRTFYADFLEKHGEGIHHLGVRVDDVDAETDSLAKKGVKVLFGRRGRFAYMDTGNPGGVMYELIQRPTETA
jgi:4-hydroxyphenylpyruvate dioxygenase-like putative hemolysin